jgi:hypothetical protein
MAADTMLLAGTTRAKGEKMQSHKPASGLEYGCNHVGAWDKETLDLLQRRLAGNLNVFLPYADHIKPLVSQKTPWECQRVHLLKPRFLGVSRL